MPRLVIRKGQTAGRDQALGGECVVGRHPTVHFVLDDNLVSRRHFRVFPEGGAWVIEDLASTNGTRVNGQPVKRQPLVDGDAIAAGSTVLVFVQKDLLGAAGGAKARHEPQPAPASVRRRAGGQAPVRRRRRR